MIKKSNNNQSRAFFLAIALLIFCTGQIVRADDAELKGNIEESDVAPSRGIIEKKIEPMPAPVMAQPKLAPQKATIDQSKLQGDVKDNALQGAVDRNRSGALKSEAAKGQANPSVLQGTASKGGTGKGIDPDADDKELIVEWDKWRNKFLWAVQSGVNETLSTETNADDLRWDASRNAMVPKVPLGAAAWFSCQVTPDRQIINPRLIRSSGYPGYDKAVMDAVSALSGSAILRYPARSKRKIVAQEAGIQTAENAQRKYFKFNDVERRIIPGDQ